MSEIERIINAEREKLRQICPSDVGSAIIDTTVGMDAVNDPFFQFILVRFAENVKSGENVGSSLKLAIFFAFQGGMLYERGLRRKVN